MGSSECRLQANRGLLTSKLQAKSCVLAQQHSLWHKQTCVALTVLAKEACLGRKLLDLTARDFGARDPARPTNVYITGGLGPRRIWHSLQQC